MGEPYSALHRLENDDDRALIARLVAGETEAYAEALRAHWPAVSRFGMRLVMDAALADDIAQETFIRLWEHRATLDVRSLRAHLLTIVRNLAMDELRKRSVRARFANVATGTPTVDPVDSIDATALHSDIDLAVSGLPARRREAFVLAFLNDLPYKEVAAIMQTSVATVRNQVSAALTDLRQALAKYRNGGE